MGVREDAKRIWQAAISAVQPDSDFTGSFDLDEKRYAKSALQQQGAFYCE